MKLTKENQIKPIFCLFPHLNDPLENKQQQMLAGNTGERLLTYCY